jgi:hypothetical protein
MSRETRLRRRATALLLAAALAAPLPALAAPLTPTGPLAALWARVVAWLGGDNGPNMDPNGLAATGDNGPTMDPDGLAATGDNGPNMDPDGFAEDGDRGPNMDPNG